MRLVISQIHLESSSDFPVSKLAQIKPSDPTGESYILQRKWTNGNKMRSHGTMCATSRFRFQKLLRFGCHQILKEDR